MRSYVILQAEDLDNLEWFSHFVEESLSEYFHTEKLFLKPSENKSELKVLVLEKLRFTIPVQTEARTKRTKTGLRVWPMGSPEPSSSSSSSTSSMTSFLSPKSFISLIQTRDKARLPSLY
ncbi:GATA transcription factor 5 [Abeliophyllum distichum]|uniref:GATA transcription factor 5 n=1 Tax=Abeliophyllum distichum TaxID=126358 RepID=A0ABD1TXA8_9LAMI